VSQVRQNLVDYPVDAIRGRSAAYTRLARDLLRNVLILHLTPLYSALVAVKLFCGYPRTHKLLIKKQEPAIC
jgi:hypothetical protein